MLYIMLYIFAGMFSKSCVLCIYIVMYIVYIVISVRMLVLSSMH